MDVIVFGLANESSLLLKLRNRFPSIEFKKAVSDNFEKEGRNLVVLDTIRDIPIATLFEDLQEISPSKSLEGSGALITLRILHRIGSIDSVRLIAVPDTYSESRAFDEVSEIIKELLNTSNSF
jgi:hypothetical protein